MIQLDISPSELGRNYPNTASILGDAKISLRRMIDAHVAAGGQPIALEVDGGVTAKTAPRCIEAGADVLVAGTAVFGAPDYAQAIAAIKGTP